MPEQEDGFGTVARRSTRAEAGLERVAMERLPMHFDAGAELLEVCAGEVDAGIDGRFRVGGRLGLNKFAGEIEKRALFAARPGQEGSHRDGSVGDERHSRAFQARRRPKGTQEYSSN